jgi:hypothetical protein
MKVRFYSPPSGSHRRKLSAVKSKQHVPTFERAITYANDVGLLSDEVDARSGELLGNFPQALSHRANECGVGDLTGRSWR